MKVLIISHLAVATQNNIGITFLSLFSRFEKEELCQLYIYPAYPAVDRCSSFYRVTDKEVLLSIPRFRRPGGVVPKEKIHEGQGLYEDAGDESFYRSRKNKSALRRLMRDAMWQCSRWYHPGLKEWLAQEKPDCIFVAPGPAKFLHNMALRIARDLRIPIITYICDEYYFVAPPEGVLDRLRLHLLQKKIEKLIGRSSHLVVICDELKQAYARFGVPATVVMNGASGTFRPQRKRDGNIYFFGNIRCNRYLSLAEVGQALSQLNRELGTDCRLKIYTSEKSPDILDTLRRVDAIALCGFVTGEAFRQTFEQAGFLLHVEAFDADSIDYVRHSISTKIADSLSSGIPLLAYGPECVSSMGHLIRNGCAYTATDREALPEMLRQALTGENVQQVLENARRTAEIWHVSENNSQVLKDIARSVIREG